MSAQDHISVRLAPALDGAAPLQVDISSTRKSDLTRIFIGKPAVEALPLISRLYAICGMAHFHAAFQACQSLTEDEPLPVLEALTLNELIREHVLHIALHWSAQIGEEPPRAHLPPLMQAFEAITLALQPFARLDQQPEKRLDTAPLVAKLDWISEQLDMLLFGKALQSWKDLQSAQELRDWCLGNSGIIARVIAQQDAGEWAQIGAIELSPLPSLARPDWNALFQNNRDTDFCQQPMLYDQPCETGPLERRRDHTLISKLMGEGKAGLLARQMARSVDLVAALAQLRDLLASLDDKMMPPLSLQQNGSGIGQVETARGRLLHAIDLQDGLIRYWAILAPTEWNFHPQGAAAQSLAALSPSPGLEAQARQIMLAMDPCVAFTIEDATGAGKGACHA